MESKSSTDIAAVLVDGKQVGIVIARTTYGTAMSIDDLARINFPSQLDAPIHIPDDADIGTGRNSTGRKSGGQETTPAGPAPTEPRARGTRKAPATSKEAPETLDKSPHEKGEKAPHFLTRDIQNLGKPEEKDEVQKAPHFTTDDIKNLGKQGKPITVSKGFKADRERYQKELQDNPALREKLFRIARNEQGRNPAGVQGVIEETMNRASAAGHSLAREARFTSEGGYYDNRGHVGASQAPISASTRNIYEQALANALGGANTIDGATDNSSGSLAQRERGSGRFVQQAEINGEHFMSPGTSGNFSRKHWQAWYDKVNKGGTETIATDSDGKPVGVTRIGGGTDTSSTSEGTGPIGTPKVGANYMHGQFGAARDPSTLTTINPGGHRFQINKRSAPHFEGFVNDLIKAGAPVKDVGGYSPRPGGIGGRGKMSQHAYGNAVDINQTARNKTYGGIKEWTEAHQKEYRELLRKHGMTSGGDWTNPDFGHFEWNGGGLGEGNDEIAKK